MAEISSNKEQLKLRKHLIDPQAIRLIPETLARKWNAIPLEIKNNVLQVAMANPADLIALEALEATTHMTIEPEAATAQEVQEAIDFNYRSYDEIEKQISNIPLPSEVSEERVQTVSVNDAPIVRALALIIDEAVKAGASDVHIQPQEENLRVRYRIDGTLHEALTLPLGTANPLISRIKILAGMNIADHLRPQDGQFSITPKGRQEKMDIRVGIIPTVYGEMAALRLLYKARTLMTLSQLGFLSEGLAKYEAMLKVPHGMILLCGPTGSGKTTTLYASINTLDLTGRNVITVEDPVEYHFKKINQIQVNPRAGLTFASGLRSILRLDPNVILIGEIRDAETAGIAVQAALTGHLVLSSIHANEAVGVVFRLLDLGIERFLVASALIGVVAQRMVRKICPECAEPVDVSVSDHIAYVRQTGEERSQFLSGRGCKSCAYTGYQGRTGLYEILRVSEEIRAMVLNGASATELRNQAMKEGMMPLIKEGMLKVKADITTPDEVLCKAFSVD
ncbi:MAG: GspE/PulE family protein [Chloroflexota bacterium]